MPRSGAHLLLQMTESPEYVECVPRVLLVKGGVWYAWRGLGAFSAMRVDVTSCLEPGLHPG